MEYTQALRVTAPEPGGPALPEARGTAPGGVEGLVRSGGRTTAGVWGNEVGGAGSGRSRVDVLTHVGVNRCTYSSHKPGFSKTASRSRRYLNALNV